MAAQQPPTGQPAALDGAMHRDGAERIGRAARVIAANVAVERADHQPIRLQKSDEQPLHVRGRSARRSKALAHAPRRSELNTAGDLTERGSARTTTSVPAGVVGIRSAAKCRSRRRTRFRTCALPIALDTTNPTRTRVSGTRSACNTKVGRVTRTPDRMVRWKSAERVIRAFLGSTGVVDWFQAESFSRPLRRRAATMARPARVRIRRRNPCVRLRRRLLGWNVRLLTGKLPQIGSVTGSVVDCRSRPSTLGPATF